MFQLLSPLTWCHMYVPNLPVDMFDAVNENFLPFIVGIQKKYLSLLKTEDKCIVNIDEDRFISGV